MIRRSLFIIGLILVCSPFVTHYTIGSRTNQYQVSQVSKKTIINNQHQKASYDYDAIKLISESSVLTEQGDNLPVIGGIAIPELSINLPIFKGVTNANLLYGAGTMKDNQVMGGENNYALASHHVFNLTGNSNMLFSPLERAKNGMVVYLTDKTTVYTYTITEITTVTPEQLEVLNDQPNQSLLTLITCQDAKATRRLVVKASLTSSNSYDNMTKSEQKAFSYHYNQLQKESP